jgi:hypothetical protein
MPTHRTLALIRPAAWVLAALLSALILGGCDTYEMDSLWLREPIQIDGDTADWEGSLYFIEDQSVSVGIKNDRDHLYLCLITHDPNRARQALGRGLILWLDPSGGENKAFGINYPMGGGRPPMPGKDREGMERDPEAEQETERPAVFESLNELKVLDPEDEGGSLTLKLDELQGMEIAVQTSPNAFAYEIKLPLNTDDRLPFSFQTAPGRTIGIGLEIPEMDMENRLGPRPGPGGGPGGMPGGGGGMGGRPGGMGRSGGRPGGFDPDMFKGIKIWSKIHLATDATSLPPFI